MFSAAVAVHVTYTVALCTIVLVKKKFKTEDKSKEQVNQILAVIMLIIAGLFLCSVFGLFCFHCKLAGCGETTNEELRGKFAQGNPFDEGCTRNWKVFC